MGRWSRRKGKEKKGKEEGRKRDPGTGRRKEEQ